MMCPQEKPAYAPRAELRQLRTHTTVTVQLTKKHGSVSSAPVSYFTGTKDLTSFAYEKIKLIL